MQMPVRVLYVDDNPFDHELVRDALVKEHGEFLLREAESRQAFETCLTAGDYDVVLTDFDILGFEGLEVIDAVRATGSYVPVILLTGTGSEEIAVQAIKRGAADYVTKTVHHIQRLPHTILAALDQQRQKEAQQRAEAALADRLQQMAAVQTVASKITQELNLNALLKVVMDSAVSIISAANRGTIYFWDEASNFLVPRLWHGYDNWLQNVRLRLGEGIIGTVAERRQGLRVDDYLRSPHALLRYAQHVEHFAILAEPLIFRDTLLGVISVGHNNANRHFTVEDGQLLAMFAAQSSIAIQNAQLYQQIQETRDFLNSIATHSADAIIVSDLDGCITFFNPSAEKMSGYAAGDVLGRSIASLYRAAFYDPLTLQSRLYETGQWQDHETAIRTASGQWVEVSISYSMVYDTSGSAQGILAIAKNITARKRLEREVLTAGEQTQRRIGQDLHDSLGQQLTGIAMLSQGLAKQLAAQGTPESEQASTIARLAQHSVAEMRALSQGLYPVELASHGLLEALHGLADTVQQSYGIGCRVQTSLHEGVLPESSVSIHLYRMVQEAIRNAVQHGGAASVAIGLTAGAQGLVLTVDDDGCGIADDAEHGMGLSTMRYRANVLGATFDIQRLAAGGTRLTCCLPNLP